MKRFGMLRTALAGCLAVTLALMPLSAYAREEKETKPAVSDTAQTTGENAADNRESLRDALAGKQSGDGSLALDMARLCALLGYEEDAGLQVSSAPWIGDYETCAVEDGIAVVPGGSRYLMVESPAGLGKRNVIWAGVIGDADAPQAGLRLEKQTAAKDQKGVALDLSELFANYDSERVVVQAAGEGKTYSVIDPDDGIAEIGMGKRYVIISIGNDRCLWAGVLDDDSGAQRYAVRLAGDPEPDPAALDWTMSIDGADAQGVTLSVEGVDDAEAAAWNQAKAEIIFLDKSGKDISSGDGEPVSVRAADVFLKEYKAVIPADIPDKTAEIQARLMLGDVKIVDATVKFVAPTASPSSTPKITPSPSPAAELVAGLRLDEDSVEQKDGAIEFSGTVTLKNGGDRKLNWTLYVNGQLCKADWSQDKSGASTFTVREYKADVGSLSVSAQAGQLKTDEATLEVTEQIVRVQITGWSGAYDGQFHEAEAVVNPDEEDADVKGVKYFHAVCDPEDEPPEDEDWKTGLPRAKDAGTLTAYVRAEREGCRVVYLDGDGEEMDAEDGYVTTELDISPAEATLVIWAEQKEEAVYNGREQNIVMIFRAETASGSFSAKRATGHADWVSECSVSETQAGRYPVEPDEDQFQFIETIDPNYAVAVEWKKSEAVIQPKPVTLESSSAVALYGTQDLPLKGEQSVSGTKDLCDGIDYFKGDVMARGEQDGVGVSPNSIVLSSEFQVSAKNYDLTCLEGVLAVFPQSLSADDPAWESAKDKINPADYAGLAADELPGYYAGMSAELKETEFVYDGREKAPVVLFSRDGRRAELQKGTDYELSFFRDGVRTDDLTNAGEISVHIAGKGNYAGTVTLSFVIQPAAVGDTAVRMDSWDYDGTAAGSENHQPKADNASRFVYYDAQGQRIDPPADAGSYTVQAVWESSDNRSEAQSPLCAFAIHPVAVTVILSDSGVAEIVDPSGLFKEDMLLPEGNSFVCPDKNFNVTVQWEGLAPGETPRHVRLDGWVYDGTAAGSENHQPEADDGAVLSYLNAAGEEIDPPADAGRYTVVARWSTRNGERADRDDFEILPRIVTVYACDAEKTWGDEDPALTARAEGLLEGDGANLSYALVRAAGEEVGSYAIEASGEEQQGNYALIFERGRFEIRPRNIESAVFEWFDDAPVLSAPDGGALEEGTDYALRIDEDQSGLAHVTVTGLGHYEGERSLSCPAGPLEATLTVTDHSGAPAELIDVDYGDKISVSGELKLNKPVQTGRLSILVNGKNADAALEEKSDGVWAFAVTDFVLSGSDAEKVTVAAAIDGETRCEREIPARYRQNRLIWLGLTIGLTVAALICLIACVRLSKRLKKERLKLLDTVSRQSNRTIRDNRD